MDRRVDGTCVPNIEKFGGADDKRSRRSGILPKRLIALPSSLSSVMQWSGLSILGAGCSKLWRQAGRTDHRNTLQETLEQASKQSAKLAESLQEAAEKGRGPQEAIKRSLQEGRQTAQAVTEQLQSQLQGGMLGRIPEHVTLCLDCDCLCARAC